MSFAAAVIAALAVQSDTTINLGLVHRDLTGDGTPEILRLVGVGRTIDSLDVTFTVESSGTIVYRRLLSPLTRTVGFDAGRRTLSAMEHRARIAEYGSWFFHDRKFSSPIAFLENLRLQAPVRVAEIAEVIARDGGFPEDAERAAAIWHEIQRSPVTIFEFSPGGDEIVAIGWSVRDGRFYRLVECC